MELILEAKVEKSDIVALAVDFRKLFGLDV